EARLVTRNRRTTSATYLVRFPAGFRRALRADETTFECFLLEGDLAVGSRRVRAGGFLAVPLACGPAKLVSERGATGYVFGTPAAAPQLPAYTAGIHSSNVWQEPWIPSALIGMRHGIAAKSLRVPDVRTGTHSGSPSGFLRLTTMPPGFAEPRHEV